MLVNATGKTHIPFRALNSVRAFSSLPKGMLSEMEHVIALARKFNDEVVKPTYLEADRLAQADPDYLPHGLVEEANQWGFYTMWLPKVLGGKGYNPSSLPFFCEELSSVCVTTANLIAVHYLGMVGLTLSINYHLSIKIFKDIVAGEKNNVPTLCSFAITEPNAGTDSQYPELMDRGKLGCHAQKVEGGYRINGTKVFISNGHLSTWHIVFAFSNLKKPSENFVIFAVKTGADGFAVSRQENKMGQKFCPASELVFTDCFIPDDQICFDFGWLSVDEKKAASTASSGFSAAQGNVGAFSCGVARGAFQDAVNFASVTKVGGKFLINQEWAQCKLAEMYRNATIARAAFTETISALLGTKAPQKYYRFNKYFPHFLVRKLMLPLVSKSLSLKIRRFIVGNIGPQKPSKTKTEKSNNVAGMGSFAKVTASDLAVKNCQLALEFMGHEGLRHSSGTEKRLRDARLLQIYEGTNQMNSINMFKYLIAPHFPNTKMYED